MTRTKTDPSKLYRPIEPVAFGELVVNLDTRLPGDHEVVAGHPEFWVEDSVGDEELGRRREAIHRASEQSIRDDRAEQRALNPPPEPGVVMVCTTDHDAAGRSWQRGDRMLSGHSCMREHSDCWAPLDQVLPPSPA